MNLEQLINSRRTLNNLQSSSLIDLLGYKCGRETKLTIKSLILNKFFTCFDGKAFSRQFEVHDTFVEFRPIRPVDAKKELKAVRDYLLLVGEEK